MNVLKYHTLHLHNAVAIGLRKKVLPAINHNLIKHLPVKYLNA